MSIFLRVLKRNSSSVLCSKVFLTGVHVYYGANEHQLVIKANVSWHEWKPFEGFSFMSFGLRRATRTPLFLSSLLNFVSRKRHHRARSLIACDRRKPDVFSSFSFVFSPAEYFQWISSFFFLFFFTNQYVICWRVFDYNSFPMFTLPAGGTGSCRQTAAPGTDCY